MRNYIIPSFFSLVFITLVSISIVFASQNVQIQKPIITAADTDASDDEDTILEEEQEQLKILDEELEQLKNKYQNRGKEVDPGIIPGNPEMQNDKIDPGIFLGDPEELKNIDPGIVK